MALPTSYLTSSKNLDAILAALRNAKAPEKFTVRFLESLDFKTSADRLVVGVLKSIGFLDAEGRPKERYFRFLDQTQSATVLAEGIREAYADLFQIKTNANTLAKAEIVNKFKTLSQGTISESVLDKMAMTFMSLVKLADFATKAATPKEENKENSETDAFEDNNKPEADGKNNRKLAAVSRSLGGLHYNIQIILPESRDPKVYDALFRSLKEHMLDE